MVSTLQILYLFFSVTQWVIMGTARNDKTVLKLPVLEKCKTPKDYDHPDVLRHTFETLSNLHKLLPNHLMELLYSYKSEEDREKCMWVEGRCEV